MQHMTVLGRLVTRVRWRLKLQTATSRLVLFGAVALGLLAVTLLLWNLRLLPVDTLQYAFPIAGGIAGLGLLSGLLRRVDPIAAAQRLDNAGGLKDRLGSALAFSALPSLSPMQRLAVDDAASYVGEVKPKAAAPWFFPAFIPALVVAGGLAGGAWFQAFPVGEADGLALKPLPMLDMPNRPQPTLTKRDREKLEREKEKLEEELAKVGTDPRVRDTVKELNELIRQIQEGKLTPKEAFSKFAELEAKADEWNKEVAEGHKEASKKIAEAAKKQKAPKNADKDLKAILAALREQRFAEAARKMDQLAAKVKNPSSMSRKDRKRLGKDLAKLADAIKTERTKQEERLKKDRDRLKKKEEKKKDRFSKRDRDRLKKNKRELERLRREHKEMSEARRQLERLQRNLDQAAQDMLRRLAEQGKKDQQGGQQGKASAEQMKQAAEMLRRLQDAAKGSKQLRVAQGRIVELKELLRQAGRRGKGGKDGKGGDGKGGKMQRFLVKAGGDDPGGPGQDGKDGKDGQGKDGQGKDGQDVAMLEMGKGKGGGMTLLGGDKPGGTPLPGPGKSGQGKEPGEGMGDGHDPNALAGKTSMKSKSRDEFVRGKQGKGPSQSRVVFVAAKKGFASHAYRQVHQDYSGVVEDALDQQKIPAGQRRYVRRYFDLIRPR